MNQQYDPRAVYCPGCGNQVRPDETICLRCGRALAPVQPVYQQPAYQQPAYQQPVYQQPAYQQPAYQQPAYQQPPYGQPAYQPALDPYGHIPQGVYISKSDFVKKYAPASFYKSLRTTSIICYIFIALNFLMVLFFGVLDVADGAYVVQPWAFLDVVILMCLTLGMHLGRSKACAIGILIYAVVNMILMLALYQTVGGWLWLVVGFGMTSTFSRVEKQYGEFCAMRGMR